MVATAKEWGASAATTAKEWEASAATMVTEWEVCQLAAEASKELMEME